MKVSSGSGKSSSHTAVYTVLLVFLKGYKSCSICVKKSLNVISIQLSNAKHRQFLHNIELGQAVDAKYSNQQEKEMNHPMTQVYK